MSPAVGGTYCDFQDYRPCLHVAVCASGTRHWMPAVHTAQPAAVAASGNVSRGLYIWGPHVCLDQFTVSCGTCWSAVDFSLECRCLLNSVCEHGIKLVSFVLSCTDARTDQMGCVAVAKHFGANPPPPDVFFFSFNFQSSWYVCNCGLPKTAKHFRANCTSRLFVQPRCVRPCSARFYIPCGDWANMLCHLWGCLCSFSFLCLCVHVNRAQILKGK